MNDNSKDRSVTLDDIYNVPYDYEWISPRPKRKRETKLEFKHKENKAKKVSAKISEVVPSSDVCRTDSAPIILQSPKKPKFIQISELQVKKQRVRKTRKTLYSKKADTETSLGSKNEILSRDNSVDRKLGRRKRPTSQQISDFKFLLESTKEGFLEMREKNSKRWHKRWVTLGDTMRCHKDLVSEPILEISLNYAAVKRNTDKLTQFEIITSKETYEFNTDNQKENIDDWIESISSVCNKHVLNTIENDSQNTKIIKSISNETRDTILPESEEDKALIEILSVSLLPINATCADCNSVSPEWASINLGTFICLQCSGVHRSFGTHISQVRSVRLDKWNFAQVNFMKATGNKNANTIWEYSIPSGMKRITPESSRKEREDWLHLKYIEGRFKKDYTPKVSLNGTITPQLMKQCTIEQLSEDKEFCKQVYDLIFLS